MINGAAFNGESRMYGGCDSENVKRNRCCPERIKFAFAKMHFIRRIVAFGMGNVHTSLY